MSSPVGTWTIEGSDEGITRVYMPHERPGPPSTRPSAVVREGARQLRQYFDSDRRDFDVVLAPVETSSFRRACWDALLDIPYGAVATYTEVARAVGRPLAARAVGNANHANPWPILIPCHRVVARNGLGGYGGGVDVKEYLLELERRLITP